MSDHARTTMTAIVRGGGRLSSPAGAGRGGGGAATEHDAGQAVAKPFVKWAGGKRSLTSEIESRMPKKFNDYLEPFVGGGAVFFHLKSRGLIKGKASISDVNRELILTYEVVRDDHEALISALEKHQEKHHESHYLKVRDMCIGDRNLSSDDKVVVASRFIYLNKTCFNGLYRVNRRGQFNVPMGSYSDPNICDRENIVAASAALEKVEIEHRSFDDVPAKRSDFVYCDPPYHMTFTGYTDNGFRREDQEALCRKCAEWKDAGAYVVASNNDCKFIRSLYNGAGFKCERVNVARHINCDGSGRGKVAEVIISGAKARSRRKGR